MLKKKIKKSLENINLFLSENAQSRPTYQAKLTVEFLLKNNNYKKYKTLLDVGGGYDSPYVEKLKNICQKYINLEIKKGKNVDIVGSAYSIPFKKDSIDVISMFMVLEHLNEPLKALQECSRVLKKKGYLALTTVQYWQTHNYPNDYYRYTRQGLEYLCKNAGLTVVNVYSLGGPWLVLFHAIEINLRGPFRIIFSILFYKLFNFLDWIFFKHYDTRKESDSVGWNIIAQKK